MADRLDKYLVSQGLARSRSHAQDLIRASKVKVNGVVVHKSGFEVHESDLVEAETDPWVSRAAHKLLGAFEQLGWPPIGPRVLDAGASTGGFTQVLLSHGAKRVYAVDVGHDQLAAQLRHDPRVAVREGLNLRELNLADLDDEPVDLIVADVSFISLTLLIPALSAVLRSDGWALLMVKPQFEVGKDKLGVGGVVRAAADHQQAVARVVQAAAENGWVKFWQAQSQLPGPAGNLEFFVGFKPVGSGCA